MVHSVYFKNNLAWNLDLIISAAVSSAKFAVVDSGEVGRSAVYSRYNNGPRTLRRVLSTPFQPLRGSVCCANKDFRTRKWFRERYSLNLYRSPVCHTLSNTWEMSKNAAEQYCLFSRDSHIHRIIWCLFFCGMPLTEAELMTGHLSAKAFIIVL
jgi:hypothetical protein